MTDYNNQVIATNAANVEHQEKMQDIALVNAALPDLTAIANQPQVTPK